MSERGNRGNAEWKSLSDKCEDDPRRHIAGFSKDICLICGESRLWAYGLVKHKTDDHIIYHVKLTSASIKNGRGITMTSTIVDGKAQL